MPGEAIRIMTGSPLPAGADAVVMKEYTRPLDGDRVEVLRKVRCGENVRGAGEDVRVGQLLLRPGDRIRPYEVALLASQGITGIDVVRRPRAAILATGDELVGPAEPLSPGRIRNSNGPTIAAALSKWGVEASDRGIAGDDPAGLEKTFREIIPEADLLLVSGGVSVGDHDFTRSVLDRLEMREVFWKVAIKPGKPLLFGLLPPGKGRGEREIPVFGLPGNPISVLVCLEEFVRPAVEALQGLTSRHPGYHMTGTVQNEYVTPEARRQYLFSRVSREGSEFRIHVIRPQGSAMVGMACGANALAVAPMGTGRVGPGDRLAFRWLK
jgi:molybdopterin molybdotransferase